MGIPPQAISPSGEGSWITPVLFIAAVAWVLLQWRPRRRNVWARRWAPLEPVAVTVVTDILATWVFLRSFKLRQVVSVPFWRERLQFKKIWRDYQQF